MELLVMLTLGLNRNSLTLMPKVDNFQSLDENLRTNSESQAETTRTRLLPNINYETTLTIQAINKTYTNGFRAKTGVIEEKNDELVAPRAQKYNRFLGQQIKIEINQHVVNQEELSTNHADTMNLLFYDFNSGARQFRFGMNNNVRLATKGDFRRTGMAGAQLIDKNVIELMESNPNQAKRRPITSQYRGGDRLPSRASKTRERSKRIQIGSRKKSNKRQQQGLNNQDVYMHESVSPKNNHAYEINDNHRQLRQNIHTALPNKKHTIFEDFNNENAEPMVNGNLKFRERINRKKDIIIEEDEDNEEDVVKFSQNNY